MIDMNLTGQTIKMMRKKSGYSAAALSEMIGVSLSSYYHWEQGISLPTLDNIMVLSRIRKE